MSKSVQANKSTTMLNSSSNSSLSRATGWHSLSETAERRRRQNRMAQRKQREGQYEADRQSRKYAAQNPVGPTTWEHRYPLVSPVFESDLTVSANAISSSNEANATPKVSKSTDSTSTPASLLPQPPPDMPRWFNATLGSEVLLFEHDTAIFDEDGPGNHSSSHISGTELDTHDVVAGGSEHEGLDMSKRRTASSVGDSTTFSAGHTALHKGAMHGHEDMVRLLLTSGANPELCNHEGRRALHLAADKGHVGVLTVLLDAGADIEAQDAAGERPLHIASVRGHCAAAQLLISKGARVDAHDGTDATDSEAGN